MAVVGSIPSFDQILVDDYLNGPRYSEFEDAMIKTAFGNHQHSTILYCLKHGFELTPEIEDLILTSGDPDLYEYLFRTRKLELISKLTEISKWLQSNECPFFRAGEEEHLSMLQWCREDGGIWPKARHFDQIPSEDIWVCDQAAHCGYLEVLHWCRETRYPWSKSTCAFAAAGGHLEVLQWLVRNGCPECKNYTLWVAQKYQRKNIVEWRTSLD